jgi:predicted dehydrogenase
VTWRTGQATELLIEIDGVPMPQLASSRQVHGSGVEFSLPQHGYLGAFTAQWKDVIEAVRQQREPRVTSGTAIAAVSLVEAMYGRKRLLDMPYLEPAEQVRARQLAGAAHSCK